MEWVRRFNGGYRTQDGRWSVESRSDGWVLALRASGRDPDPWFLRGKFRTLREAKEYVRKADGA